jgi:tRNA (cmo5U34)-methyltransferase
VAQIDRLFSKIDPDSGTFSFDENVARVFDDMISRSVPLYADVQRSIPTLTNLLDHDPIRVIDLGCSTGTSLIHLSAMLPARKMELIGVDNSQPMLDQCQQKLQSLDLPHRIETVCDSVQSFEFERASVVLMNYTLQFVPEPDRPALLRRISESIRPGGFLLISEKVAHEQPAMDDALVELYFEYKRRQGYSELEISRKRDALENVLVPLTTDQNLDLIASAGFTRTEVLLKWFNFATFLCCVE